MTKVCLLSALLSLSVISCRNVTGGGSGDTTGKHQPMVPNSDGDMTRKYESILYSLGAVPVSALGGKFWRDGQGWCVYSKGERLDINGWLPPYWAEDYLTPAQMKKFGLLKKPLQYSQYAALLDIDGYKETKHPLQFVVMAMALENMRHEGIKTDHPDAIIRVYEAGIGLEEPALALLHGRVTADDVMRLYGKHEDPRLLDLFPAPQPAQAQYIEFLRALVDRKAKRAWKALRLLYTMDKATYKVSFRDFLIAEVRGMESWGERASMYEALVEIRDDPALDFLAESLLKDPVTECREWILLATMEEKICPKKLVDAAIQLAKGEGGGYDAVTPSRSVFQWEDRLGTYLTWVKGNEGCSAQTRTDAAQALELLKKWHAHPAPWMQAGSTPDP